jgi:hypothetical protein
VSPGQGLELKTIVRLLASMRYESLRDDPSYIALTAGSTFVPSSSIAFATIANG